MSRIVQTANFVTPSSGGLRTCLRHLAEGYAAAGHEVVQVLPGPSDSVQETPWGRLVHVAAPLVPGTGYRVVVRPAAVARVVDDLRPDRLEVHDRLTLRRLGRRASRRGVPSLVVSHERLDVLLDQWLPHQLPLHTAADRSNEALAAGFDHVVCTTEWAAEEFTRLGVRNLRRVPLGVDLDRFTPDARCAKVRSALAPGGEVLLLAVTRLSKEKAPELAVDTVAELVARGVPVRLVVAGDGPLGDSLRKRAAGLPVSFLGHVAARTRLAELLATADVVLAPGPVETFGLAALEALASGTAVVGNASSALPEVLGPGAGLSAEGTAAGFADAVQALLAVPDEVRTATARARAEQFPWSAAAQGFLDVHRLGTVAARRAA